MRYRIWQSIRNMVIQFTCWMTGFFVLVPVTILRPFIKIQIGLLRHERLGHLLPNMEYWLRCQSRLKPTGRRLNLFLSGTPINRQVLVMIKRKALVYENNWVNRLFRAIRNRCTWASSLWIDVDRSGFNAWDEWNGVGPQLSFTPEEEKRGQEILRSIGIGPGEPFICFAARDQAFLDKEVRPGTFDGWGYHDYRNSKIENFLPAVEYMVQDGIWALRMGKVVEQPIACRYPRMVDYATRFRSDFADVYLISHCTFFLGDSGGINSLAAAFNVPYATANLAPFASAARNRDALFLPKTYREVDSGRMLPFPEVIKRGADQWSTAQRFDQNGIEVLENTADEILDLAVELKARLDGSWEPNPQDEMLQEKFRRLFPPHNCIAGFPSRVGAQFLRQHRALLENQASVETGQFTRGVLEKGA